MRLAAAQTCRRTSCVPALYCKELLLSLVWLAVHARRGLPRAGPGADAQPRPRRPPGAAPAGRGRRRAQGARAVRAARAGAGPAHAAAAAGARRSTGPVPTLSRDAGAFFLAFLSLTLLFQEFTRRRHAVAGDSS